MTEPSGRLAPKYTVFVTTVAVLVGLDQLTKVLAVKYIDYASEEITLIPGFLSLIQVQNPGAALGMLRSADPVIRLTVFGLFTVVASIVLLTMLYQLGRSERFQAFMLALIFSGAIGNGIDRVDKQTVTDFIKVYTDYAPLRDWLLARIGTAEYPTFNIADSAIVVGVGLFLVYYLFFEDKKDEANEKQIQADVATDPPTTDKPAANV